jgi:hypothetical protein
MQLFFKKYFHINGYAGGENPELTRGKAGLYRLIQG